MPQCKAIVFGALVATLSCIGLIGCGDNTTSDTEMFILANDEGDPPRLSIIRVVNGGPFETLVEGGPNDAALQGVITIAASVGDTDSGRINILGEWSTDGGVTWNFATGFLNPSPPATAFGGSLDYFHDPNMTTDMSDPQIPSVNCIDFVWDTVADLGVGAQVSGLIFRLTPDDFDEKERATSDQITIGIDNQPSVFAPEADNVSTPTVLPNVIVPGANVSFTYRLKDTDNPTNLIGICPQFSTDGGGSFTDATEAMSSASEGVIGLTSSPSGIPHSFVWDSAADFIAAGILCSQEVVFRVEPKDIGTVLSAQTESMLMGISDDSGVFTVANFPTSASRGVANVPTPQGIQSGCISIGYSISDADSSPSAVIVEFSTDGGVTFQVATENTEDMTSEGFCTPTGISTSPVGIGHLFAWDTISDGLSGLFTNVIVRITPFDGLFGTPASTMPFVIDNPAVSSNSPPGIIITTPDDSAGPLSDAINIGYRVFDIDSNPVDIFMNTEFSNDGGMTWFPATFRNVAPFTGNTGLESSPCGTVQTFVWDSLCDEIGLAGGETVIFRVAPTDINGTGAFATTAPFMVVNSTLPTVSAADIVANGMAPLGDGVEINYTLQSTVATSCASIIAEYSPNGGVNFLPATEVVGPPSEGRIQLTAGTTPLAHTFVWDSRTDGVGTMGVNNQVIFRIRPVLVGIEGSSDISQPFSVDNP